MNLAPPLGLPLPYPAQEKTAPGLSDFEKMKNIPPSLSSPQHFRKKAAAATVAFQHHPNGSSSSSPPVWHENEVQSGQHRPFLPPRTNQHSQTHSKNMTEAASRKSSSGAQNERARGHCLLDSFSIFYFFVVFYLLTEIATCSIMAEEAFLLNFSERSLPLRNTLVYPGYERISCTICTSWRYFLFLVSPASEPEPSRKVTERESGFSDASPPPFPAPPIESFFPPSPQSKRMQLGSTYATLPGGMSRPPPEDLI